MEITINENKSAVLPIKIGKEECKILIDTGATMSCMREDYYRKIPGLQLQTLKNVKIKTASHQFLQTIGKLSAL